MKRSPDQIDEIVSHARDYVKRFPHANVTLAEVAEFAEVLVQLTDSCVVGLPCARHSDIVHGKEAEELRSGVEQILGYMGDADEDDELFAFREAQTKLSSLLDHVDARDSLAFREAQQPSSPNPSAI